MFPRHVASQHTAVLECFLANAALMLIFVGLCHQLGDSSSHTLKFFKQTQERSFLLVCDSFLAYAGYEVNNPGILA